MDQRMGWSMLVVLGILGQALGQVVRVQEVFFADSAGASPGQPAKQGAIHCAGRVVDPNGRPVADAKVTLSIMQWSEAFMKPRSQQQSMTGPDGTFSFSADNGSEGGVRRSSIIVVDRSGFAWGWSNWDLTKDTEGLEIPLTAAKSLAGTVVDETGRPVAEAQVTLAAAVVPGGENGRNVYGEVGERLFTTSTDGSGRFRLERLPADASVDLLVRKPGLAVVNTNEGRTVSTWTLQYAAGTEDIRIQMPVEARIDGVVVEKATGKPVSGIKIEVARRSGGRVNAGRPIPSREDGTFAFEGLLPGTYVVRSVRQSVQDWAPISQQVVAEPGKTTQVRLELVKGGILEVVVREDQGRRLVEKAYVQVRDEAHAEWHSGTTDSNGMARIQLETGEYQINSINKDGYAGISPNEKISIEEGKTVRYEYTFAQQPRVRGIVFDPNGSPLEGISLQVYPGGRQGTNSDTQGRFEARWDPSHFEQSQFCLVARDVKRNLAAAREVDAQTGQVEIKLEPGLILTGRVVDPNSRPLAKATVYVMLRYSNWGSTIGGRLRAGSDGRFSMAALPQVYGYDVMANAEGFGQTRKTVEQDEAVAGIKDVGDIQLALANLSITGVVVDVNDIPVADASINAYGEGQPEMVRAYTIGTDAQGRFTIKGVCEGPIQISASIARPQEMSGSVRTEGGATDVKIVVRDRSTSTRFVPKPIPSLRNKPMPDLKTLGVLVSDANDKPTLVCFCDIEQRPSRRCLSELARKGEALAAKGVQTVVVQTSKADLSQYKDWLKTNQVTMPIRVVVGDFEAKKLAWGVKALPWLILTDKGHKVTAEGFGIDELEERVRLAGIGEGR